MSDQRVASPGSELRRVRSLIADLDAIVWEADAQSLEFTFVSEGVQDILGYSRREWLSEPSFWADRVHPEDREHAVATFIRAASEGHRFDHEYRFFAKDGTTVWLRDLGHVVTDVEARPVLVRGLMVEVTPQKAAEAERIESQERFRRVVEHLTGIVYIEGWVENASARSGPMIYVSPQIRDILGFEPEDWMRDPAAWVRQIHRDDRDRLRRDVSEALAAGEPINVSYRAFAKDGRQVWFRDEAVLVKDEAGRPLFWQGIMFDITSQRLSDERARESESRYRTLIEHLPAIVYTEPSEREGVDILYVSPRVEPMLGISAEEWIADPRIWFSNIHPDDRGKVEEANLRAAETGEPFVIDYRMVARDGRVVWFHDEAVLVTNPHDGPSYWQGVMMEVTAQKDAQAQLADAEARYRALVEQTPAITYLDAVDGPVTTVYMSPQTTTILGYTPEEWYADPNLWSKIVHPDDRDTHARGGHPEPQSSEYRLITKDGRTVWVHDQASLITDEEGKPRYWQGVLVDITERKLAEELARELDVERETAKRLRALDEMKNTFLQAVSHDLRTPLAAILGLAVTVESAETDVEASETREMARRIADNARKLDRLVNDLLDLDRLSRGIVEPTLRRLDLGGLVEEIVGSSEILAGRHLEIEARSVSVPVDVAKLDRIVENLLSNTARHTPPDARVWVRVEPADGGAVITVEDDGPGVPRDQLETIFEPFARGEGSAGEPPGLGVGLSLVARFAELHDGRAWVEERPGGGASFKVFLPGEPTTSE